MKIYKSQFEKEYAERFEWRKSRQIENLIELSSIAQSGGAGTLDALPRLAPFRNSDDPKDALRTSILHLWAEAAECYIFGNFQSCILACGAVVERCLKLQYQISKGTLPRNSHWTLGKCIEKCSDVVSPQVLQLSKQILGPRNSRAHALLEHDAPLEAYMGGDYGVEILASGHAQIEPYRGDAKSVVEITYKILKELFGA